VTLGHLLANPDVARKLKPRDWSRIDRELRHERERERIGGALDRRRSRIRLGLVTVVGAGCGVVLAVVRPGGQVWCSRCRVWLDGTAESGKVG